MNDDMMFYPRRPAIFVLTATDHGPMIVNRFDFHSDDGGRSAVGVGFDLLNYSNYDEGQLGLLCKLVEMRREAFGDGVVAIDGGANIGVYTLTLARLMTGWGSVIAFEPYKWAYRMLCGNICLTNALNAEPIQAALGNNNGTTAIEWIDPRVPR